MAAILTGVASAKEPVEPFRLPVPMVWQVNSDTLSRRQYLKDIDRPVFAIGASYKL